MRFIDATIDPYRNHSFTELSDPTSDQIDSLFVRVTQMIREENFSALITVNEMIAQLDSPLPLVVFRNGRAVVNEAARAQRISAEGSPMISQKLARLTDDDAKLVLSNALRYYVRIARDPILLMQIGMQEPCIISDVFGSTCMYALHHSLVPFPASLLITPAFIGAPQQTSGGLLLSAMRLLRGQGSY